MAKRRDPFAPPRGGIRRSLSSETVTRTLPAAPTDAQNLKKLMGSVKPFAAWHERIAIEGTKPFSDWTKSFAGKQAAAVMRRATDLVGRGQRSPTQSASDMARGAGTPSKQPSRWNEERAARWAKEGKPPSRTTGFRAVRTVRKLKPISSRRGGVQQ